MATYFLSTNTKRIKEIKLQKILPLKVNNPLYFMLKFFGFTKGVNKISQYEKR